MKRPQREWGSREESIGGDFWASYSDLMAGLLMVFILLTSIAEVAVSRSHDDLRELLTEKTKELKAWNRAIRDLCEDQELRELEVAVDCDTGAISLPNHVLFEFDSHELKKRGQEVLRGAIPRILARLERDGRFWDRIDKIEVIGHSDPIALRDDPYGRNLKKSQERAYAVLKFLTDDSSLSVGHRNNMHDKAVAAGAADTRPPASCQERSDACYPAWRRVEIHVDFSDSDYRRELNEVLNRVMAMVGRNG